MNAGRIEGFSGSTGAPLFVLDGTSASQSLGGTLTCTGDLDRDGIADFITNEGCCFPLTLRLISGAIRATIQSFPIKTGIAGIGDINGDGVPDLGLGNVLASIGGFNGAGIVDVIAGGTWETLYSYSGTFTNEGLGAVEGAGDFDGDGVPDFVIAAPGVSTGSFPAAPFGAWVHSGRHGKLLFRFRACSSALGIGDVNGDGLSDVAFHDRGPGGMGPTIWTFVGGPDGRVLFRIVPPPPYLSSGLVSRTGDIDGDGADDYAKTDPLSNRTTVLFFSGRDRNVLMGIVGGEYDLIAKVEPAGDTNGDDFPDLLLNNFHPDLATNAVRLYSGAPDGVSSFGLGCAFPNGVVPRIGFSHEPKLGETVRLNLSRVPHDASTLLLLGTSSQSWLGLSLPIDLAALGLPGCPLLVAPDVVVPLHTGGPDAGPAFISWPLAIPEVQGLQGASFYAQFLVLDEGNRGRGAVTRGLQVTIQ